MAQTVKLTEIMRGKSYEIVGFRTRDENYAEKLYKMGFVNGTPIELAPVKLADPMVVQIRGSRIALRKREAQEILVKER